VTRQEFFMRLTFPKPAALAALIKAVDDGIVTRATARKLLKHHAENRLGIAIRVLHEEDAC